MYHGIESFLTNFQAVAAPRLLTMQMGASCQGGHFSDHWPLSTGHCFSLQQGGQR
jgi:hypothetical protein